MKKNHLVGDADSDNANAAPFDVVYLAWQFIDITVWDAVCNENGNIWYVRAVPICTVKDVRTHQLERTGCVCPSAEIRNVSDCSLQTRYVGEIGEVKVQRCKVPLTYKRQHIATAYGRFN